MATEEHALQAEIRNELAGQALTFRVNVGRAWTGNRIDKLPGGRILIHEARPFSTGLPPGFSDLFGLVPVTITPDMVGQVIGVFHAIEVKGPRGHVSPPQVKFVQAVIRNGGRAGVARSISDALEIVKGEPKS